MKNQNNDFFGLPDFRIRCSAIGQIMTEPSGKSPKEKLLDAINKLAEQEAKLFTIRPELKSYATQQERIVKTKDEIKHLESIADIPNLGKTCISYLEKWVTERIYERRVDISTKTMKKGLLVEDDAITYACGWIPEMGLANKNSQRFRNHFMEGEPDVINDEEDYVFDTKCSWDHTTFPLYYKEVPDKDYYWQLIGYMGLTGKRKARVVYVLMSMPEEMIQKEARWRLGYEFSELEYVEFSAQFRYDDLPAHLRLKEFEVEWDEESYLAITNRVLECRQYINDVILPSIIENLERYGDGQYVTEGAVR